LTDLAKREHQAWLRVDDTCRYETPSRLRRCGAAPVGLV
jgi:hypothetical protein